MSEEYQRLQGPRRRVVHLPGGVTVTLNITYYHRQKDPAKASQKPKRGLYPTMANDFAPIIDGTLASCDRLFAMLEAYLISINITEASRVLFVADGAACCSPQRQPGEEFQN